MNKIITTLVALVVCLVSTAKVKPADESQMGGTAMLVDRDEYLPSNYGSGTKY